MPWFGGYVVRDHLDAEDAERAQAYRDAGLDRGGGGDDDDDEPAPRLRPRHHWGLVLASVLAWLCVMAVLGVHWWDFDTHGPWLTPVTPFLLAGAAERALIRWRPEWERDHDPGTDEGSGRRRAELGDAARPYWARGGTIDPPGEDDADATAPGTGATTARDADAA